MVRIMGKFDFKPATPNEAREIPGLKKLVPLQTETVSSHPPVEPNLLLI